MLVIGITGGTGAGKTTLLDEIGRMGGCTIDCDALYHELLRRSTDMLSEIEGEFPGVVRDGVLDRKALGKIVFSDSGALLRLNEITHKYVAREVDKILADAQESGRTLAGVDAIALIESGISKRCDATIGVIAPQEHRVRRLMQREGITREYALLRINAQKQDEFFMQNCDYILQNDFATEDEFRLKCRELLDEIIVKAKK